MFTNNYVFSNALNFLGKVGNKILNMTIKEALIILGTWFVNGLIVAWTIHCIFAGPVGAV